MKKGSSFSRVFLSLFFALFLIGGSLFLHYEKGYVFAEDSSLPESIQKGLVPCGSEIKIDINNEKNQVCYTGECSLCDVQTVSINVVTFLAFMLVFFGALLLFYAGILLIFFAVKPSNILKAKSIIWHTLIGLFATLASWILVDSVMRATFTGSIAETKYGPWEEFLCKEGAKINCYDIIEPLKLDAKSYVLSPYDEGLDCKNQLGGRCVLSGLCGGVINTTAKGCGVLVCCLNKTTDSVCVGQSGKQGTCHDFNFCTDTGEISNDCEGGLVCCPSLGIGESLGEKTGTFDCNDNADLQREFGGIGPVHGPGLDEMIACYKADSEVQKVLGTQPIYTYERSNDKCNYTNGNRVCGKCAHSPNSCHYGAGTGLGALAADFNARNQSLESDLCRAIKNVQNKCGGKVLCEGTHTHVSLNICPKL
jgi:hypothetical protein